MNYYIDTTIYEREVDGMPVWLSITLALGGSTIITLIITFIFNLITNSVKKRQEQARLIAEEVAKKDEVLKRGVQALLRHELYNLYDEYYTKKGYAPLDVKNDFEFIYLGYHNLGKNGVMDGLHERFMKLPDSKSETKKQLREDK